MRWMNNMEEWSGMLFEDLLKNTKDRRTWSRLVHEATNPRIEDGSRQDKTRLLGLTELLVKCLHGNTSIIGKYILKL